MSHIKKNKKQSQSVTLLKQQLAATQALVTSSTGGIAGLYDIPWPINTNKWNNKPFNVVLSYYGASALVSSVTVPTFTAQYLTLGLLANSTSYTAAFDQYRFMMVRAEFIPSLNSQDVAGSKSGTLTTVLDYDDATAPSTIAATMEYETKESVAGDATFQRRFVPRTALAAYAGAFTSYANVERQWIDCNSPNVQQYGIKTSWSTTSSVQTYDVVFSVWLQFRAIH